MFFSRILYFAKTACYQNVVSNNKLLTPYTYWHEVLQAKKLVVKYLNPDVYFYINVSRW